MSFRDWLRRNGQSDRAIANFWDLIVIPTLNDPSHEVSASMAFMVFQVALLRDAHGADIGFPRSGLSDVMGDAIERRLRALGVDLILGRTVERLVQDGVALAGNRARQRRHADRRLVRRGPATRRHSSTPCPDDLREASPLSAAASHTFAPIVNLHVWYDRAVADFEWTAFVDSRCSSSSTRLASPDCRVRATTWSCH